MKELLLLILGLILNGKVGLARPTPMPEPTGVPVATETPMAEPTATPRPTAKPTAGCDKFRNGQVIIEVHLKSSDFKGATLVEVKPAASCPGVIAGGKITVWMQPGVLTWSSPELPAGRYVLTVANGNYQGVITKSVEGVGGVRYVLDVGINRR